MKMTAKIMLMFASQYDMPAANGNNALRGVSVEYYYWGEHGEELERQFCDSLKTSVGVKRCKGSIPYDSLQKIGYVPGVYEASFEMSVNKDGKPVMNIMDIEENYIACQITEVDVKADSAGNAPAGDSKKQTPKS